MNKFHISNCRICFSAIDLQNVCDISENGSTYYEELLYIVPEIDWADSNLPSKICTNCIEKAEAFTEFKIMCIQSSVPRLKYIAEKAKQLISNDKCHTNDVFNKDVVLNVVSNESDLLIEDDELEDGANNKQKLMKKRTQTRKKLKKLKVMTPISEDLKSAEESNDISLIETCGLNDFETFEFGNIEINPSIDRSLSQQMRDIDLHILGSNESLNLLKGISRRNSISSDTQSIDSTASTHPVSKPTSIINPEEFFNNDIDSIKEDTVDVNKVHCAMCNIKFSSPEGLKIHNNTFHNAKVGAKDDEKEKCNENKNNGDSATITENLQEFLTFNANGECDDFNKSRDEGAKSSEMLMNLVTTENQGSMQQEDLAKVLSHVIVPAESKREQICLDLTNDSILLRTNLGVQLVPLNETIIAKSLTNKIQERGSDILSGSTDLKMCAIEGNQFVFYPNQAVANYTLATENSNSEISSTQHGDSQKELLALDLSVPQNEIGESDVTDPPVREVPLLLRRKRNQLIKSGEPSLQNGTASSIEMQPNKSAVEVNHVPIEYGITPTEPKETKPYLCDVCGQTTSSLPNLIHHKEMHSPKLKFQCKECPKRYKTLNSLKYHVLLTHKEKRFSCNICGYKCATSTVMKSHIRRHKMDYRYACTLCPKHFIEKHELNKHMRHHTGKERLRCVDCDGYFHDARTFRQHRAKHEMAKREESHNNTDRQDTEKENLQKTAANPSRNDRLSVPEKSRPEKFNSYKCTMCNKIFATVYNRQNHSCTVIGRRYNYMLHCKLCSEQLKFVGMVRSHLMIAHGIKKKRDEPIDTYFEYI